MAKRLFLDAHQDIAWNTTNAGRDYRYSAHEKRTRERETDIPTLTGNATNGLPDALEGNIGLIFATLYACPAWASIAGDKERYSTPEEAQKIALSQLAVYDKLFQEDRIRSVRTLADLEDIQPTWGTDSHTIGMVVLMEGADPIQHPRDFGQWYEKHGVRIVGLAWSETRYSGGTVYNGRGAGKLTPLGKELMKQMESYNAVLDLSHMAEEAYLEAVDLYEGIVIASHSNPRTFRNTDRHLTDDMMKRLFARGGVMGLVPFNTFLHSDPEAIKDRANTPLSRFVEAIDYVCQLAGSAQHVGIGSDYDGGFGVERIPLEMDTVADFQKIADALTLKGYTDSDIDSICHANFLRVIRKALS